MGIRTRFIAWDGEWSTSIRTAINLLRWSISTGYVCTTEITLGLSNCMV